MTKDLIIKPNDFHSSFLSCDKDSETIFRRLLVESRPYSDELKRLLVINTNDCLSNKTSQVYKDKVAEMTLPKLLEQGYIKLAPKIKMPEHEEVKSYIILTFDNFAATSNPQYRDCNIIIDILCHTDYWDLGGFKQRPLKIAGYIDGILNNSKLSGIGKLEFVGCNMIVLDQVLSGYSLIYRAVHGSDDRIEDNG